MRSTWIRLITIGFFLLMSSLLVSQNQITLPRPSPQASVTQTIGLTDISINYSRPAVKGRTIWGNVVPYGLAPGAPFGNGKPFPWRAGANENTTISFSTDVKIAGVSIPAGTYSLHILPRESAEWLLIINKDHDAWGSYFYDDQKDVVRVPVPPVDSEHQEWLAYGFDDISANSVSAYLHWEKKKVPFTIKVDVTKTVLDNMRKQLTSLPAFNWQATMGAANFCLQNNINQEEALGWIDRSINNNRQVSNMAIKAGLLSQLGRTEEASKMQDEAWAFAVENGVETDINQVGYMYLTSNKVDEALKAFKLNVKKFPKSWNVYDSLADGYEAKGNRKEAIKNYKLAHEKAPENQKPRIVGILERLENES